MRTDTGYWVLNRPTTTTLVPVTAMKCGAGANAERAFVVASRAAAWVNKGPSDGEGIAVPRLRQKTSRTYNAQPA